MCSKRLRNARYYLSEFVRVSTRQNHHATFYFDLDDPYSTIMLPVLIEMEQAFQISFDIQVVEPRKPEFIPEQDAQERYSLIDAGYLAQAWGLDFPNLIPNQKRLKPEALRLLLLHRNTTSEWLELATKVTDAYWHGDFSVLHKLIANEKALDMFDVAGVLKNNTEQLYNSGYYSGSSIHYRGEWYWGLDRLYLLKNRLQKFSAQEHKALYYPDWGRVRVPSRPQDNVDMYFSFRSPYSYIAIARLMQHKNKYPIDEISFLPVLPMVTRGLPVPRAKKLFILKDAARIAHFENIPFGRVRDPLGDGVSSCMALYFHAPKEQQFDLIYKLMTDIWSLGKDVSQETYINDICKQFSIQPDKVHKSLKTKDYEDNLSNNMKNLSRLGLWGVPSFSKGKLTAWGQDRMPLVFSRAFQ
ncbi:DsbA family protein [Litoribacillus peritrichatus]|uniref:DsbA family protein n=1 Tax=Litoribacillus peritrichatus TaxID=718191 RepID=A0ABP7MEF8_9GAMM